MGSAKERMEPSVQASHSHEGVAATGSDSIAASILRGLRRLPLLFYLIVVLPSLSAVLYYGVIAAPRYVSEAEFVANVKNAPQATGGLDSLLSNVGVSSGSSSTVTAYEVKGYMTSRAAVADLMRGGLLLRVMGRPEGDLLYRFPRLGQSANLEDVYKAYGRFVTVEYNMQSGILSLKVQAFRPGDAQRLAQLLLDHSETWITALNERALADAVAQQERQVEDAERSVARSQAALTTFRATQRIIDPDKTAAANLELLGHLEAQIDALRAQRDALAAAAPKSAQLPILDQQIAAFEGQLGAEKMRQVGESDSLAPKVADYEKLLLDAELSSKALETALAGLEAARLDARQQQVFLDRVVEPNLPQRSEEPQRFKMIVLVIGASLLAYGIVSLIIAGLREHNQR